MEGAPTPPPAALTEAPGAEEPPTKVPRRRLASKMRPKDAPEPKLKGTAPQDIFARKSSEIAHQNDAWTLKLSRYDEAGVLQNSTERVFLGTAPEERRYDPETGKPLTRKDFMWKYGQQVWDNAEREDEEDRDCCHGDGSAAYMANWRAAERARDAAIKDFMRTHKCSVAEGELEDEDWSIGEVDSSKSASCIECEARLDADVDSPSNYEGESWWTHTVEVSKSRGPMGRVNMKGKCRSRKEAEALAQEVLAEFCCYCADGPTEVEALNAEWDPISIAEAVSSKSGTIQASCTGVDCRRQGWMMCVSKRDAHRF